MPSLKYGRNNGYAAHTVEVHEVTTRRVIRKYELTGGICLRVSSGGPQFDGIDQMLG